MVVSRAVRTRRNICGVIAIFSFGLNDPAMAKKKAVQPPGAPAPLTAAERNVGLPGVRYADIIEAKGEHVVAPGAVADGQALLTIPYAYRHTAVVTEDVKGFSFTVKGVLAPAGSPGYYAGTFSLSGDYGQVEEWPPMDMWCFFPNVAGGKRENICLFRNLAKLAAIAPTRKNPYLWDRFSPMTGSFDYVRTPIFKRQAVALPVKPVLEYRFAGWAGETAKVKLLVVNDDVETVMVPKDMSGTNRLRTIIGDFLIAKDNADPAAARISAARSSQ
jgi:hypothetical protein